MEARLNQELPLHRLQQAYSDLFFENEGRKAEIATLRAENKSWLRENAPGGWIDDLRADASQAAEELATLEARLEGEQQSHAATMGALREMEADLTRVRAMARRIERDRDDWAREGGKLQLELARERERFAAAIETLKNAKGYNSSRIVEDFIDEAIALLEPQPAPASEETR